MTINTEIKVLDHGFVRLIDSMGSDLSIVRSARVSYDADWRAGENEGSDFRLVNYLWKNKHTSPFESVTFTFEVKAPIFVFRQWHRHRTWSYNEVSARYSQLPEEFYLPDPRLIGKQSESNKQMRDVNDISEEDLTIRNDQVEVLNQASKACFKTYQELIDAGWPRELARSILPVSTYSHMFCSVNLLNLLKFITLRNHAHAQHEIQVYADALLTLIEPIVPITVGAWRKGIQETNISEKEKNLVSAFLHHCAATGQSFEEKPESMNKREWDGFKQKFDL